MEEVSKKKTQNYLGSLEESDRHLSYSQHSLLGKVGSKFINETKVLLWQYCEPKNVLGRSWNILPGVWEEAGLFGTCCFLMTITLEGIPAFAWASPYLPDHARNHPSSGDSDEVI